MERKTIQALIEDAGEKLVIDIRSEEDYKRETYPGAIHIFHEDFMDELDRVPKDRPVYLICYTGQKSDDIAEELSGQGYEIYSIDGGFHSYLRYKLQKLMEKEEDKLDRCEEAERSIVKKFRKEIWRKFTKAINEYELIQDGDRIAVCISGGKDSMLMAKLFQELERHGKKNFEVVYLVMNPGYNELNYQTILNNAKLLEVPVTVFKTEIFDTVADITESPCYLCARMRRGYLYSKAKELGCNKIALGHHFDDVIETILMGMLYGAQIQTMMPKLHSTNFEGMELIRPLYLIREADIIKWMHYNELHFIQCACRFTENCASCGGTEKGSKRAEIKELIHELAEKNPVIEKNIFRSVENVNLSTVIAYKQDGVTHHFLTTYAGHGSDSDKS
ncbi:rhodanese-like domain-containing protein [Suilimivivens aceti]|uniref:Rhodanese-like domain-containing protein n=2 Tax=Suilimivivens aceti TaxID=2981774 RepID=A0ABT2T3W9_9FIRM|nr:ATP-binding protein [Suilimivivens aceti]MCU6744947.1 rhodanese-like domain-containing protein [Suilimivivens aceti]